MAKNSSVLFVANDTAPVNVFRGLAVRLGEPALLAITDGKAVPSMRDVQTQCEHADVALIGMSSSKDASAFEVRAAEVMRHSGKPYAFFADTPGGWRRGPEWFGPVLADAELLFVCIDAEVELAKQTFPEVKIVASGNPSWDTYMEPGTEIDDARHKLGIFDFRTILMISGTKKAELNCEMITATFDAMRAFNSYDREFTVAYMRHPKDLTDNSVYEEIPVPHGLHFRIHDSNILKTDIVLPGANVLIHPGNSSVGWHAGFRGIPIIDCPIPLDEYIQGEVGGWEFTPHGSEAAYHPANQTEFVKELATIVRGDKLDQHPLPSALRDRKIGEASETILRELLAL